MPVPWEKICKLEESAALGYRNVKLKTLQTFLQMMKVGIELDVL